MESCKATQWTLAFAAHSLTLLKLHPRWLRAWSNCTRANHLMDATSLPTRKTGTKGEKVYSKCPLSSGGDELQHEWSVHAYCNETSASEKEEEKNDSEAKKQNGKAEVSLVAVAARYGGQAELRQFTVSAAPVCFHPHMRKHLRIHYSLGGTAWAPHQVYS